MGVEAENLVMHPCPCGSGHVTVVFKGGSWLRCESCGLNGPAGDDPSHAIIRWNLMIERGEAVVPDGS